MLSAIEYAFFFDVSIYPIMTGVETAKFICFIRELSGGEKNQENLLKIQIKKSV